ncbi:exonuclease I Exo1 [Schizosaccharomyces japonicus yFS275]|uniref:Exonuclease 1 n=1 Tax=Schizosaccharomyces japonicus (strain yFS275 / FY16936) TaxID=402676 RepID=B6JZ10_SCHJY|nr:exonuclease I Exo1 [Schizosaccharomyces japonicus yFS275]EEB06778.1 exonuclease I Exo1 [Schizosaccharomyces japonicus yFS275]
MGVKGLLGLLKDIQKPSHIEEFSGKTLGVDAYVWLHKGVFACAKELAFNIETDKYIQYAMHRISMLTYYGVKPFVVFDGGPLPSKLGTEEKRRARRKEALELGKKLWNEGKRSQAMMHLSRSIDVTPEMANRFAMTLRQNNIPFVVAPYEADPQLVYLEKTGFIDGIITEDSDMLIFGARTVLFKLDNFGNCDVVRREDIPRLPNMSLQGFNDHMLRYLAIFSGCDYTDGIGGIGLKKAIRFIQRFPKPDAAIRAMRAERSLNVPIDFEHTFTLADKAFQHQRVYCPQQQRLVHLNDVVGTLDEIEEAFVGLPIDEEIARQIAIGEMNPITKEKFVSCEPLKGESKKRRFVAKTDIANYFPTAKRPQKTASLSDVTNIAPQRSPEILASDAGHNLKKPKSMSSGSLALPNHEAKKENEAINGQTISTPSSHSPRKATTQGSPLDLTAKTGSTTLSSHDKETAVLSAPLPSIGQPADTQVESNSGSASPKESSVEFWKKAFSYKQNDKSGNHTPRMSPLSRIGVQALSKRKSLSTSQLPYKSPSFTSPSSSTDKSPGMLSLHQYKFR